MYQHVLHVLLDIHEIISHIGVVRIPWLSDLGVSGAELTDERYYPYDVVNHGKSIPLGHNLLSMQDVVVPVHILHH